MYSRVMGTLLWEVVSEGPWSGDMSRDLARVRFGEILAIS